MIANVFATAKARWPQCQRWLVGSFIATYLSTLGGGLFCHTFQWNANLHPMAYFVVWDMFCGWSAHECRYHVLAEAADGRYYQVLPGPWGDFHPHGELSRHHYDPDASHSGRMAMNVLRHTRHEGITRLLVVEENWPKKFNMPDDQWSIRWDEPKDPKRYFTLRHVITPDGILLQSYQNWYAYQSRLSVAANPRLAAEMRNSQPFYAVGLHAEGHDLGTELAGQAPAFPRFGSAMGN